MKCLLSRMSLVLLFLFTLSMSGDVQAAETKADGQVAADQIASFANKAIYNLDTDQLLAVVETFLNENPNIKAATITESIDQERLLTYYRQDDKAIYDKPIPEELLKLMSFSAVSMFEGEQIGTINIYYASHSTILLNAEELAWITDHPIVRVHNETEWPPFNFAVAGDPQGFSIDFMNLLAKKTGIVVEYVSGPSWNEFIEMMKNGDLDVMLNIVKTPERLKYLLYTPPYAENPNTILSKRDKIYKSIEHLVGKTVAVPKGFFYEEILKRDYPKIKILAVKNMLESMKAVSFGNADAAFGELAVFNHLMTTNMMSDLVIAGEVDWGNPELTLLNIATRKDLPILASILTKGMKAITKEEKQKIQQNWFGGTQPTDQLVLPERATFNQADFIIPFIAMLFAIMLVVIFAAWWMRGRPKQLTIREILFVVFFIFAGLIVSIGTLVTMLLEGEQEQSKIEIRNKQSFNLALELKQSSDDLTRFARSFSATGDSKYESYYQAVVAIRDGKQPHPKEYTRSFWDYVAAGNVELDHDGETYSIEQKIRDLGISKEEQEKFSLAKNESDALIYLETVSMNAVHGRFKDANGTFSLRGKPNLEMARQLLNGKEYLDAKASIMRPIDDFFILLEWRTTHELNLVRERNKAIMLAITALTVITIGFAFYAFFLLKRRIILPLSLLEVGALTLKDGDYSNRVDISSEDEIGTLASSFNSMASGIEERTKELSESQTLFKTVIDNMPAAVFLKNADGTFQLVNRRYEETYMVRLEDLRGKTLYDLYPEDQAETFTTFDQEAFAYGEGLEREHTLEIDGQETILRNVMFQVLDENGEVASFGGIEIDITERKQAEEKLAAKEAQLRNILESSPYGVAIVKNKSGIRAYTNTMFNEMFSGDRNDSLEERDIQEITNTWVDPDGLKEFRRHAKDRGWHFDEEVQRKKADGTTWWCLMSSRPLDYEGESAHMVWHYDVTERKEAEKIIADTMALIKESIGYASRIQRSILPDDSILSAVTQDHFVLWEPRDVVGGDLYWHGAWGDGCIIILGDCTGHGVPGAFMTLIVIGALERAMSEIEGGEVGKLISRVHQYIQVTLSQHYAGGDSDDGIELGACYFVPDEPNLIFVGTRFELHINDGHIISTVKGTKQGMGYRGIPYAQEYVENMIDLKPGQSFYLTTDGLIDQIGGERRRSFGKKRFKELLTSIQHLPMLDQKQEIYKSLLSYQGEQNRRDDIALIGFKV